MAITGFEVEVPAPPLVRRGRGLLLQSLLPLALSSDRPTDPGSREFDPGTRVQGGIQFCKVGCAGLSVWQDDGCTEVQNPLDNPADDGGELFSSFVVSADEQSPANFDETWIGSRLSARMSTMISAQLASELQTGALTGNPSLQTSATNVVSAVTPIAEAMYVLEDILADYDDLAFFVHMDPGTFALFDRDNDFSRNDAGEYVTPTGHIVIADAGLNGALGPVDPDNPGGAAIVTAANGAWIYASLPVVGWMGEERPVGTLSGRFDRERNTRVDGVIRPALVAFDPCVVVAIQVARPTYSVDLAGS
jgi:hypothetical protein